MKAWRTCTGGLCSFCPQTARISCPRPWPLGWTGGPGPRALGGGSLQQCQPVPGWPPSPDPLQVSVSVSRARTRLCPRSSEQRCGRGVGHGNDWVRCLGLSWEADGRVPGTQSSPPQAMPGPGQRQPWGCGVTQTGSARRQHLEEGPRLCAGPGV